jgi:hypothetical protein
MISVAANYRAVSIEKQAADSEVVFKIKLDLYICLINYKVFAHNLHIGFQGDFTNNIRRTTVLFQFA